MVGPLAGRGTFAAKVVAAAPWQPQSGHLSAGRSLSNIMSLYERAASLVENSLSLISGQPNLGIFIGDLDGPHAKLIHVRSAPQSAEWPGRQSLTCLYRALPHVSGPVNNCCACVSFFGVP